MARLSREAASALDQIDGILCMVLVLLIFVAMPITAIATIWGYTVKYFLTVVVLVAFLLFLELLADRALKDNQ